MNQTIFTADVNKTLTVEGDVFTITVPTLPVGVHMYANEVELQAGNTITLTSNMSLTFSVDQSPSPIINITHTGVNSVKYDGNDVTTPSAITVTGGNHTLNVVGATAIPPVTITGNGITAFTVNSMAGTSDDLPYTFTPLGGKTNSIFVEGVATESKTITIAGTDIETLTIDGVEQQLPYKGTVDHDVIASVSGKIYQVDLSSIGGAKIVKDGATISTGNSELHKIIDIDKDTYFEIDGTHTLNIDGEYLKGISINGVVVPITNLPSSIKNISPVADLVVSGYEPSEVHVIASYQDTVTVDGINIPVNESGTCDFELTTVEQNHFVHLVGKQPRPYALTWDDNGTTDVMMDGKKVVSGTSSLINKDVFIESFSKSIPVHFESKDTVTVDVDGRKYRTNDFTIDVNSKTEIDINTYTCDLIVDYGDNSYKITVPQSIVTITATHRDGWIFDGWSSQDLGIKNPKSVQTTIDLTGKNTGHLVCHYQQYVTMDKPNIWN